MECDVLQCGRPTLHGHAPVALKHTKLCCGEGWVVGGWLALPFLCTLLVLLGSGLASPVPSRRCQEGLWTRGSAGGGNQ